MKRYNITVNGNTYEVIVEEAGNASHVPVYSAPVTPAAAQAPKSAPQAAAFGSNKVAAPMPGTILDIKVTVGQNVKKYSAFSIRSSPIYFSPRKTSFPFIP